MERKTCRVCGAPVKGTAKFYCSTACVIKDPKRFEKLSSAQGKRQQLGHFNLTFDQLDALYKKNPVRVISQITGFCETTILYHLQKYGIPRRSPHQVTVPMTNGRKHNISEGVKQWHSRHEHPRGMLGRKHSPEARGKMSAKQKGNPKPDVSKRFKGCKIPRERVERGKETLKKHHGSYRISKGYPPKETLERLYLEKKLSIRDIALQFNLHPVTMRRWLKFCNIPLRSRSEIGHLSMKSFLKSISGWHLPRYQLPTKCEQKFIGIAKRNNLPFTYTGDRRFWIENVNPDFVECNGRKICIEIFGDYWHTPLLNPTIKFKQTEKEKKRILKTYGWKCIVLWESALMAEDGERYALSQLKKQGGIRVRTTPT